MAKTTTTLSGAITGSDWLVNVVNKAALRPGDNIVIGTETMRALVTDTVTPAIVYRGARGTAGQAAADGATVNYGPPSDWSVGVGVTRLSAGAEPFLAQVKAERDEEDVTEAEERAQKAAEADAKESEERAKKAAAAEKAAEKAAEAPAARSAK